MRGGAAQRDRVRARHAPHQRALARRAKRPVVARATLTLQALRASGPGFDYIRIWGITWRVNQFCIYYHFYGDIRHNLQDKQWGRSAFPFFPFWFRVIVCWIIKVCIMLCSVLPERWYLIKINGCSLKLVSWIHNDNVCNVNKSRLRCQDDIED